MAELLVKISYIAFAGAAAGLILAIILFIKLKIPMVIGDLSGKNAQKAIQKMRETNSRKGNQSFRTGKKNEERGKLTKKISHKKKEDVKEHLTEAIRSETGLLKETMAASPETANETEPLVSEETTILDNVTEILFEQKTVHMKMLDDIVLVHTKECISSQSELKLPLLQVVSNNITYYK